MNITAHFIHTPQGGSQNYVCIIHVAILYSPCRVEVDFVLLSDLRLELTEADSLLAVEDNFWMTEGCLTFWENQ